MEEIENIDELAKRVMDFIELEKVKSDDAFAERIMDFMNEGVRWKTTIDPTTNGNFVVLTSAGASFEFEIVEETKLKVACAYFWHVYDVRKYYFEECSKLWARIFKRKKCKDRLRVKEDIRRMEKWASENSLPRYKIQYTS